jgi:hypothetical protein
MRARETGAALPGLVDPLARELTGLAPMAPQTTNQIHSIAEILATAFSTSALRRIQVEHTADSTGHCRGCRYPTSASPVWPCRLWEIGAESERISRAAGSS